jgi:hypothetical protein
LLLACRFVRQVSAAIGRAGLIRRVRAGYSGLFELQCFFHQQYQHAYSLGTFAFFMGLGAQQANDHVAAWAP